MRFGQPSDHLICKEIADGLREFASQPAPFCEWYLQQVKISIFFEAPRYLRDFDPKSGRLMCMDFTPSACVRGLEVHYHQVVEAGMAIDNALHTAFDLADGGYSPEAALRSIWSVLHLHSRVSSLAEYMQDIQKRADELRKKGTLPLPKERMSEIFAHVQSAFEAEIVPCAAVLAQVDHFMRKLYELCEAKKETPAIPRKHFHESPFDPFTFGA